MDDFLIVDAGYAGMSSPAPPAKKFSFAMSARTSLAMPTITSMPPASSSTNTAPTSHTNSREIFQYLSQFTPWRPSYPIPRPQNAAINSQYQALVHDTPGRHFVGRLASYKY